MSSRNWVVGRGLLGSAVAAALVEPPLRVAVDWASVPRSIEQLRAGVRHLAAGEDDWAVYWCAGRGVTSTPREVVLREAEVFEAFLNEVARVAAPAGRGRLFLASSVGGAFGGRTDPPFTERTPPLPASAYGETKLRMEQALADTVAASGLRGFIARVTNLYGAGQDLSKGQGLISTIVDSYVTGRPTSIYVPLDTLRDYVYVDDCARVVVAGMQRLEAEPAGTTVLKIVGSMTALSVGAIVGEMSRLRRKQAPVVLGQGSSAGQSLDLRVRSDVWTDLDALVSTTLPEGLGALYRARLAHYMLPSAP